MAREVTRVCVCVGVPLNDFSLLAAVSRAGVALWFSTRLELAIQGSVDKPLQCSDTGWLYDDTVEYNERSGTVHPASVWWGRQVRGLLDIEG